MTSEYERALRQVIESDKVIFRGDTNAVLRRSVDDQLQKWRRIGAALERPERGWIYTVRKALGMSSRQFAKCLAVNRSAALRFEKSETANTIRLDSLQRAAAMLHCRLVYAFVPLHGSLEETLFKRRHVLAHHLFAEKMSGRRLSSAEYAALGALCGDHLHASRVWDVGEESRG